ncbi:MAG: hypothetical protein WCF61_12015 [Terriglobales bacterium]
MSASDHQALIETLERNPELLRQVEALNWESNSRETFQQHTEPDTLTEFNSSALDWPQPEPLGGELPPVPALDARLMPSALRPLVEDAAERMQVPIDFPAVVSVLCLAGVTNRRAAIQPKATDTSYGHQQSRDSKEAVRTEMGTRDRKARLAVLQKAHAPTAGLSYMQAQITNSKTSMSANRLHSLT